MRKQVYLYGAGGHAKVILEILEAMGWKVRGVFDDNAQAPDVIGYPILRWTDGLPTKVGLLLSIGDNEARLRVAEKCPGPYVKAVHPTCYISPRALVGDGTVCMSGVSIHSGSTIGQHCIVNTHAAVDHDCEVGPFAHIGPKAMLCGNARVGEGTLIGAGAVLIPGIRVGRWAVVGAGAVVAKDVADYATVAGNPSRLLRTNHTMDEP